MSAAPPHYLLFSHSNEAVEPGRWRFALRAEDGSVGVVASDVEPEARGERLQLLSVVRGLESLDQPARVTLLTPSAYIREGIQYGLSEWRANGWRWECFGEMVPVKHRDLWQRVDRALGFHRVECRNWRVDPPHGPASATIGRNTNGSCLPAGMDKASRNPVERPKAACRRLTTGRAGRWRQCIVQAWTVLASCLKFG
jgi:ribonuclease HI